MSNLRIQNSPCTAKVVNQAMKTVSKDVRAPKVVREGKVNPVKTKANS